MRNYRKLNVWQKTHTFALAIYEITSRFPAESQNELAQKIREAATTIPFNITEGCGRRTDQELGEFCNAALGIASKLEYQLLLAKDLNYISEEDLENLGNEVRSINRMLSAFTKNLYRGHGDNRSNRGYDNNAERGYDNNNDQNTTSEGYDANNRQEEQEPYEQPVYQNQTYS